MLKPQDLVVLLKLLALGDESWTLASLAKSVCMSTSEVHGALARAELSSLYFASKRRPNRTALREFLAHGVRYAFAAKRHGMTRGMPTAHSAPVLASELGASAAAEPLVWPAPDGKVRGEGIEPLYRTVPRAAAQDETLYRLLALVDAVRTGGARERRVAQQLLDQEIKA